MDITTFMMTFGVAGKTRPTTLTFSSNGNITIPTGVRTVTVSGYGARGRNAASGRDYYYYMRYTIYATRRSDGARVAVYNSGTFRYDGRAPADYCEPVNSTPSDPTYSSNQTCYKYTEQYTEYNDPATTGASSTAFGKNFPGSLGNVAPAVTTFTDLALPSGTAVQGGTSYSIVVPSGGSITVKY